MRDEGTARNEVGIGVKARNLLLVTTIAIATLNPSAVVAAQESAVSFEEAEGPDDTCDLRINTGGPYEVTVDGGEIIVFPNESVVPVPQGSSLHYLPQERTFGATAIGANETCAVFVPDPTSSTSSSGIGAPFIAGVVVGVLVVLGAIWWVLIGSKRSGA